MPGYSHPDQAVGDVRHASPLENVHAATTALHGTEQLGAPPPPFPLPRNWQAYWKWNLFYVFIGAFWWYYLTPAIADCKTFKASWMVRRRRPPSPSLLFGNCRRCAISTFSGDSASLFSLSLSRCLAPR